MYRHLRTANRLRKDTIFHGTSGFRSCRLMKLASPCISPPVGPGSPSRPSTDPLAAPVQLVYALHTSLTSILKQSPSLPERFAAHKAISAHVKDTLVSYGFEFVPLNRDIAANGMSAVRYPSGVAASDILPKLAE